ncbi:MAG TPA: two-component regulator propeller domain-containing protein, partial [Bacteroidia bacterium]|nr:two-component regulator propeller domain-containing protein [Bacteroidia bacterium]
LSNYATWTKFTNIIGGLSNNKFNTLEIFNGVLVTNAVVPSTYMQDRMLTFDIASSVWGYLPNLDGAEQIHDMYVRNNILFLCGLYSVYPVDAASFSNPSISVFYYPYNIINDPLAPAQPQQIYVDQNNVLWDADLNYALVKMAVLSSGESFYPNGPITTDNYFMTESNEQLLVVPGGHDDAWNNVLNHEGISVLKNGWWTDYAKIQIPQIDTSYDILAGAIDPNDPNHWFLGSWGWGLLEISNGVFDTTWNNYNSTLQSKPEYQWCGISGLQYDTSGNLWMVNSHASTCLNVFKKDRTWQAFDFSSLIPIGTNMGSLMITSTGQKWMIIPRGGGILVFDDRGTLSNTSDDLKKKIGFTAGVGAIPGTEVYSMAEDHDGEIWIGTDKGIGVFYCAGNIFSPGGCDAQQILITQGSYVQILMETQTVTAIAVDGANRKWIGTEGGGVFLMSPDGQTELAHFTADNSPLLSDDITSLTIDQTTGEVFFGTSKGIVSYMGEATEGGDEMGTVYAFPNPVKHEYTGPIAITGLTQNADVKITDMRGEVVFKTTALGGRAIWDGNNFQGVRAATGVYIVFVSNADGTQKAVTKILLIN